MVCLKRSSGVATASSRLARQQRRARELASLFGEEVVYRAPFTDPASLDLYAALMETVWDPLTNCYGMLGTRLHNGPV